MYKREFSMRNCIDRRILALYGDNPPVYIRNRAAAELDRMDQLGMEDQLLAVRDLSIGLHDMNIPFSVAGDAASSFLLYLLDVTRVNPLPPHYYCPYCRKIEFSDGARDGFDLPRKKCSCGRDMLRDGHDMPMEMFWGISGADGAERIPGIAMRLPVGSYERVKDFLETYPLLASLDKTEGINGIGYRCGSLFIVGSMTLPEQSGFWFSQIESEDMRSYVLQNYMSILKLDPETRVKPTSFYGVVRMYGLTRSSWSKINNQMTVIKADGFEDTIYTLDDFGYSLNVVPVFFDDLFRVLLKERVPPAKAYREAERVRQGRGLSPDIIGNLYDNPTIGWCNSAIRILSKSQALQSLMLDYNRERHAKLTAEEEKRREEELEAKKRAEEAQNKTLRKIAARQWEKIEEKFHGVKEDRTDAREPEHGNAVNNGNYDGEESEKPAEIGLTPKNDAAYTASEVPVNIECSGEESEVPAEIELTQENDAADSASEVPVNIECSGEESEVPAEIELTQENDAADSALEVPVNIECSGEESEVPAEIGLTQENDSADSASDIPVNVESEGIESEKSGENGPAEENEAEYRVRDIPQENVENGEEMTLEEILSSIRSENADNNMGETGESDSETEDQILMSEEDNCYGSEADAETDIEINPVRNPVSSDIGIKSGDDVTVESSDIERNGISDLYEISGYENIIIAGENGRELTAEEKHHQEVLDGLFDEYDKIINHRPDD